MKQWWLYRENFPFGRADGYRTADGRFAFVLCHAGRKRYFTPQRLARMLTHDWRPLHNWQNLGMVADCWERTIDELAAMPAA